MAIFHYHRAIGKRHSGKNAVLAAAYIRGEERACEATGETKDFSLKGDVVYRDVVLPPDAPVWATELRYGKVKDSEGRLIVDTDGLQFSTYVWNQIEIIERRQKAQLYFHDDISIPIELSQEAGIELVKKFVQDTLAVNGFFCEVAIHWEPENPHAHILMPLRQLTEAGFSHKLRLSPAEFKAWMLDIRKSWADQANLALKEQGLDVRIDHRSHKARGIDLKPTVKVGKATHMKGTVEQGLRIAKNQLIRAENRVTIEQNPAVLGVPLSQTHAVMTEKQVQDFIETQAVGPEVLAMVKKGPLGSTEKLLKDIIAILNKTYSVCSEKALKKLILENTENKVDYEAILQAIEKNGHVIHLGLGEDGRQHYVTKEAFRLETDLIQTSKRLAKQNSFLVSAQKVKTVIKDFSLNGDQRRALGHITLGSNLGLVVGVAGSGKTYMLKAAREVWQASGYRLHGIAFSGRAAAGLQNDSGIRSRTIYSFLKDFQAGKLTLSNKDIVVMDEMGMTSLDDMQSVIQMVHASGAKFVGVGDIEQTQPVGRGAPMRAMLEQVGGARMDKIIRQKVAWQAKATSAMETQRTGEAFEAYSQQGRVTLVDTAETAQALLIEQWLKGHMSEGAQDLSQHILIAHKNETVQALNQRAREQLIQAQHLATGALYQTAGGERYLALGERLLFKKNDARWGLHNGEFGTLISIVDDQLTVRLDNQQKITFSVNAYAHFDYGYAATVHQLQGFTGDYAYEYIDGRGWDRHLFLVASSRHRKDLQIVADQETFKDMTDLKETISRHGLKDHLFDYPASFAIRRGFEPNGIVHQTVQFVRQSIAKIKDGWGYLANYQDYLATPVKLDSDSWETMTQRRQDAVLVADFCDYRLQVAEKVSALETMADDLKPEALVEIYQLQVTCSEWANAIAARPAHYRLALDRNRISLSAVQKYVAFGERREEIKAMVETYQLGTFYNPPLADKLLQNFKNYYGHLVSIVSDKTVRQVLMADLGHMATQARYELAIQTFGTRHRAAINQIKRYLDLDYEISRALRQKDTEFSGKQTLSKEQLQACSIERNKLAHAVFSQETTEVDLITHFRANQERLAKHRAQYADQALVRRFSALPASTWEQGNLARQHLAHQIKVEPKRYGIYFRELLKDGWQTINSENWHYEQRLKRLQVSASFKESQTLIRRYYQAAHAAKKAWQRAIKCREKGSVHYTRAILQAQGLSYQRDKMACALVNDMAYHAGALAFHRVDLSKLSQRGRTYNYFHRYLAETHTSRQLHMAHYISQHSKDFGAAMAVHGQYRLIQKKAHYYQYLKTMKALPDAKTRGALRLAERYQQCALEARRAWGHLKGLQKTNPAQATLALTAKHLIYQRNKAAYRYLSYCAKAPLHEPEIPGVPLDYGPLKKAAEQHIAYQQVLAYLHATSVDQGRWAHVLLANRASYHFIYEKGIDFNALRQAAQQGRHPETLAVALPPKAHLQPIEVKRWDIDAINAALTADPETTYRAILGEPKKRLGKEWRYGNGLVVTIRGGNAGKWYSFTEGKGGGPLQAIEQWLGLPFKEALKQGAVMAGLTDAQAMTTEIVRPIHKTESAQHAPQEAMEREKRIVSAQSIWQGTVPIQGTLAERYFTEHRQISAVGNMEMRYWPLQTPWVDYDEKGERIERLNKLPAAVIAVKNAAGAITGVQRIYLDKKSAGKNTFIEKAKLSKGIVQGAAAVIQVGQSKGRLYIAEGPETAASIAMVDKAATVLASLSVDNLCQLAAVIRAYGPFEVILAADNDGPASTSRKTTEAAYATLQAELGPAIESIKLVFPQAIPSLNKVDWNDVLIHHGVEGLQKQLGMASFETAAPDATPAHPITVLADPVTDPWADLRENENAYGYSSHTEAIGAMAMDWLKAAQHQGGDGLLLSAINASDINLLNKAVRYLGKQQGHLKKLRQFKTTDGFKEMGVNERICFKADQASLAIKAGQLGTITHITQKGISVQLDGGGALTFRIEQCPAIDYGYALPLSQAAVSGVQSILALATRATLGPLKQQVTARTSSLALYWSAGDFPSFTDLKQALALENKPVVTKENQPTLQSSSPAWPKNDHKPQ